jgi:hypothetical protein
MDVDDEKQRKTINILDHLPPNATLEIKAEEPVPDKTARLRREDREHLFRLGFSSIFVIGLLIAGAVCLHHLLNPIIPPEIRDTAQDTLTLIIASLGSYAIGRNLK